MTRVNCLNHHRWIIFILHVAFIVQRTVNAQSGQDPQPGHQTSTRTTVFAVLITIFFLIGLLSVYIRHCTNPNPDNFRRRNYDGCSRRGGLENAVVESFPVFAYSTVKESKIGSKDLECAICLNGFEDLETVRLLPICDHLFHVDCIDAWLYSHATCPVCRSDLTAELDKTGEKIDSPVRDHIAIDIDGGDSRPSFRSDISGKFPRSNSTGHSMDRLIGGVDKFTLRLPEDVKRRIMAAKGRRLKRTRSFDGDLTVKYCWSGEESSCRVGSGGKSDWVNWADRLGLFVSKSNSGSVRAKSNSGSVRSQRS